MPEGEADFWLISRSLPKTMGGSIGLRSGSFKVTFELTDSPVTVKVAVGRAICKSKPLSRELVLRLARGRMKLPPVLVMAAMLWASGI